MSKVIAEGFQLSPQQQQLWSLQQRESGQPYRVQGAVLVEGEICSDALALAVRKFFERHEILRTTFHSLPGMKLPLQVIGENNVSWDPDLDLSDLTPHQHDAAIARFLLSARSLPFDFECGPLAHATVVRLSPRRQMLLVTLSALCADSASLDNLVREVSLEIAGDSQAHTLYEEQIQYAVASQYLNEVLESEDAEVGKQFWQQRADLSHLKVEHPFLNQSGEADTFEPQAIYVELDSELASTIRELIQREEVSASSFFLAAWRTLWFRLAGATDFTIGLNCDGRTDEELRSAVGLFSRNIAFSTHVAGQLTFREVLKRTHEAAGDVNAWQVCFSWKHLSESNGDLKEPFFPYCFEYIDQPARYSATGISFSLNNVYACTDRFNVKLTCVEKPDAIGIELHYNSNLFVADDIKRLARNFQTLLKSALADLGAVVEKLEILDADEREQILVEFNNTSIERPHHKDLIQLFEEQAERTPDSIAVVFEDQQLSYAQLNARANQLAYHLQRHGIGPGVSVALCLDRSVEMVIALLGTLKAGGAYLPLDPTYPVERLRYMLEVAKAPVYLTRQRFLEILPTTADLIVCLDTDWETIAGEPIGNPAQLASAADLAYVIFTSGSTNKPKGVMISRGAINNHMSWMQAAFSYSPRDVFLQKTPFSFDASVWEFYAPLLVGGRLVMALPGGQHDSGYLVRAINEEQVTILQLVPSLLRMLLREQSFAGCMSLRYIFAGGEALSAELQAQLSSLPLAADLCNLYGPTEATVDATFHRCRSDREYRTVPIGRPVDNTQVYLLDCLLQPVSLGVAGEMFLGGAGLSRGYLDRPDLTARSFVPDPFTSVSGARMYKTGDSVRYLQNGELEFLGRLDSQLKIRGNRVELGEIEAVLKQHPAIREVVVLAKGDGLEQSSLAAFLVLDRSRGTTIAGLRSFLQEKVPDYMMPSSFVTVEALPLSPSGKVDRKALASLPAGNVEPECEYVAPRNPVEEILAEIWARSLRLKRVGVHSHFFEMGGHSILASELIVQARDAFQVEIPLRSLFETPTVAGLAATIARAKGQASSYVALPSITPATEQRFEPFPLTPIQQAYWVGRSGAIELGNVSAHGYKEFDFIGLDVHRLERALQLLVERHDMLRAIILPDGQQQVLKEVPPYELKVLDLRELTPEAVNAELEAVREVMSHEVRSADQWPLFQVRASRLPNERVRIHLSVDALIGDAWSWQLLGREVAQLYENHERSMVPLDLSFRDYILGEMALRDTELYRRSHEYWFGKLADLPPAPDLPTARNPRSVTNPTFVRHHSRLESELWRRLKSFGAQRGLTASGILLAVFAKILAVWSKSPKFTINVTLFNRLPMHAQVNDIVGDFTSVNLLAVDCLQTETFENHARRLQERLWNDIDHRYVSGVELLREMARQQGRAPKVAMPIVFTSTLHHSLLAQNENQEAERPVAVLANAVGDGYGINQTPQVWLDHQIYEEAGALTFNWDAVADIFPDGLLDDMFSAYCCLLQRLANDEAYWQQPLDELIPPVQLEQRARINATESAVPEALAHDFFLAQVDQRPQQAAIIAQGRVLSYEEVYRRAKFLGRRLRSTGARPNGLVAIVMEKGWEQVVAVLGILQAGAAYLPIDANFPQDRIWSLLEDGEVTWVLTQSWLEQSLKWPDNVELLSVDQQLPEAGDQPLEPAQKSEDLAYVIYTSGSTGAPKGVMIEHRSVVNRIIDINQRFEVGPEDRVLSLTALHHDLSVYDMFGVLGAGGVIVIPHAKATRDPSHWLELIVEHRVTLWNSVPAFMEMLVEHLESIPDKSSVLLDSLRLILMSGDWIPVTLPERLKVFIKGGRIVSLGGPTETTVWDICFPVESVNPEWKSIPYGQPMANARYYVLDEALKPRPTWVAGELYIAGTGLARGYWRDEEKTCSKFVQHPDLGERLYRSGDWGRYLPNGNIEFAGRADFQIKIQGYRVELGEIEAALEQHPLIRSVVVTSSQASGKPRLVAYVVPSTEQLATKNDERRKDPSESTGIDTQPASESGPVAHALERIEFKLKQPGLRQELSHLSSISLVRPALDEKLTAIYQRRQSFRQFAPDQITFEQFNQFLDNLLQLQIKELPLPKYRYPSAGNLYPVQTYIYIKPHRVEGIDGGVYYYHPREHCLVLLSSDVEFDRNIHGPINRVTFDESAFSIFLVSEYDAITPLYGNLARDFCTLEAGYMSQLLMMSAPDCGIGLCPVGDLDFGKIRQYFTLHDSQVLTHSLLGGRLAENQAQSWPLVQRASAQSLSSQSKPEGTIAEQLRDYLRAKLPEYMVPSAFVALESLPLTANGKVDRRLLPEPDSDPSARAVVHVKPRNEVEQAIATIVQDLLKVTNIGINDSFFELGGNSVDMVRFHGKLRETFNKEISIVEMFANPTISRLVKLFSQEEDIPSFKHSQDRAQSRRASRNQRRQSRQQQR